MHPAIGGSVGHADIVRELIDGTAGYRPDVSNLPDEDEAWWTDYRDRLEQAARETVGGATWR